MLVAQEAIPKELSSAARASAKLAYEAQPSGKVRVCLSVSASVSVGVCVCVSVCLSLSVSESVLSCTGG